MAGRLEFEFRFRGAQSARRVGHGPLRILVLGDLGGRGGPETRGPELARRAPVPVDVDEFDGLMARLAPALAVPASGVESLEFRELEDFHPDALYRRLPLFQRLRELRRRLLDPNSFPEAAAELRRAARSPPPGTAPAVAVPPAAGEADDDTLARLLGAPAGSGVVAAGGSRAGAVDAFIQAVVAPHVIPDAPAQLDVYLRWVDEASGEHLRALLRQPRFQSLESTWRGLHGLVTALETGPELSLHVLDVTRAELAADLLHRGQDLEDSDLYRMLMEHGPGMPGGTPWSLLAGLYEFDAAAEDLRLLAALGALASWAGGPFVAAAAPGLLGCEARLAQSEPWKWHLDADGERRWLDLRQSPWAPWIGLALPRFLLRVPYGPRSDPIDSFPFEELPLDAPHEGYLWGNPALVCARLVGEAFQARGWAMTPGDRQEVGDLPAHTVLDPLGEKRLQPCAEVLFSERAATEILQRGLMPLLSYRDRNAIRLARFQSIASPVRALAGAWAARE